LDFAMPQPFKRKNRKVRMSPAVVVERANLGISIANIASHWTKLESTLSLMYTYLLFGQEETAFRFYHQLIDLNLRKNAFMSGAEDKLPKELIDEIDKFYSEVRRLAKARNTVIHGTWAIVESKPNSLLLCDPKDLNAKVNQVCRHVLRMARNRGSSPPNVSVDLTPDQFIEYKHSDLDGITRRIIALDAKGTVLANKVLAHSVERAAKPPDQGG
jgi:hypothetical protein